MSLTEMQDDGRDQLLKDIERAIWTAEAQKLPFVVHILAMAYLEAVESIEKAKQAPPPHP